MKEERSKNLRERANQILKQRRNQGREYKTTDLEQLIEELSIHQIELELQNQELSEQQEELKAAKDKYFNLYNLAPVAYLSLNSSMQILEANRHAHELFNFLTTSIIGRRITEFIHPDWQDSFYFYIRNLHKDEQQRALEIKLNNKFTGDDKYLYLDSKILPGSDDKDKNFLVSIIDITSRKNAEKQAEASNKRIEEQNRQIRQQYRELSQTTIHLRHSQENLSRLIEAIPNPIVYRNPDGIILGGNTAAYNFFGIDKERAKGKTLYNFVDKETADFVAEKDREILETGEQQTYELELRDKDNELRQVIVYKNTYNIGEQKGIVAVTLDVTEERRTKNYLIESENKFRTLFEEAGDIIFIMNHQGKIINSNLLFSKKLGYTEEEIANFTIDDICKKRFVKDMSELQEKLLKHNTFTYESGLLHKKGYEIPAEITLGQIQISDEIDYLAIARDISERKKAEKALANSERKFRNFFRQSYEGIALIDQSGRIVEWNKASETLTGISEEQAKGMPAWKVYALVLPPEKKNNLSQETFKNHTGNLIEGKYQDVLNKKHQIEIINQQNGERRYVNTVIFRISYDQDQFLGTIFYDETARLEAERKLARNEQFFRNVSENMSDMVSILDKAGNFTWVSPSHYKILGYKPEEMVHKNAFSYMHPKDKEHTVNVFSQSGNNANTVIYRVLHKNGSYRWLEGTGQLLAEPHSSEEYAIVNARDITKRKRAVASLKQHERLLNKVIENATVGIRLIDPNKNIIKVNKLYAQWHDKEVQDILNKKCFDYLHFKPGNDQYCNKLFELIKHQDFLEKKIFTQIKGQDKYFIYNAVSFKDENNEFNGILEVFKDITELEIARRNADMLLKRLNMAIEVGNLGWWEWNINTGNVEFAAKKITMLGYEKGEIKPDINGFIEMIHPDDKEAAMEAMRKHLRGEAEAYTTEYRLRRKNGGYLWFYDQGQIVSWNKDGSPARMIGVIYNIDKSVKQREQLKSAKLRAEEANRTKSEFLANMSHEIRTPLNSVLGFAEILKAELGGNSNYDHFIDGINSSAKNLLNLINDILDVSKIEAGKLQIHKTHVDIQNMLAEMHQIFSIKTSEKGLNFEFHTDEKLPRTIITDAVRMRQILFNLIGNAVKFTEKGSVKVTASADKVDYQNNLVDLTVKVTDTGMGISEEEQKVIFEPFRQQNNSQKLQKGGTGLGLTITKRLVEMLNGKIWLKSKLNEGSEFTFTLYDQPIVADKKEDAVQKPVKDVVFMNQTVLIIEDDINNRNVIKGLLKGNNLNFLEAGNGKEGIKTARDYQPDIILMDLLMPEADGIEATRKLKNEEGLSHIPVITITAAAIKEKLNEISTITEGVLYKPIAKLELVNKLSEWLEHKTVERTFQQPGDEINFGQKFASFIKDETAFSQEVQEAIRKQVLPAYKVANRSYSLSKIEEFARAVEETGRNYNIQLLIDYTRQMQKHTKHFKFEKIMHLLDDFSIIANEISKEK